MGSFYSHFLDEETEIFKAFKSHSLLVEDLNSNSLSGFLASAGKCYTVLLSVGSGWSHRAEYFTTIPI